MPKAKRMALILKSAFKNQSSVNNQNENDESVLDNEDLASVNDSPASKPRTPETDADLLVASQVESQTPIVKDDDNKANSSLNVDELDKEN